MLRIPAVVASLVLAAAGLSGCALLEDIGGGDLDDALELVPGGATAVVFKQRADLAELLDLDDVDSGSSAADLEHYAAVVAEQSWAGTQFAPHLTAMAGRAAFSELDIVWEVYGFGPDGSTRAYKMREDLVLDDIGDDLVAATYTEDELSRHRYFYVEPGSSIDDGRYPAADMLHVALVPDEQLMLVAGTRSSLETAVAVFDDDADSLTDAGTFVEVIADSDDETDYAVLEKEPYCESDLSPEQASASGRDKLGSPVASGFFVGGDGETTTALAFVDEDAAESDLSAREAYLDEAVLLDSREPLADVADWELERDGNLVRIGYEFTDDRTGSDEARHHDGFHACHVG
jgi:hypothetical protein